jgi:hypothetical protein
MFLVLPVALKYATNICAILETPHLFVDKWGVGLNVRAHNTIRVFPADQYVAMLIL